MRPEAVPDHATPSSAAAAAPASSVRPAWCLLLLARLPFGLLYGCAALIGALAYYVYPYRVHVVRENLTRAFPDFDDARLQQVIRAYYLGFAQMLVEVLKATRLSPAELRRRVRIVNLEPVRALLAQGHSVLLVAAHQGNWEWMLLA